MHAYRPNHYEALGVPRNADGEATRTTWRVQAKQLHPDLSEGGGLESTAAFLRLLEAYGVLRDPDRRAHYDATLARQAEAARRPIRPQPRTRPAAPNRTPKAAAAPSSVLRTAGLGHFAAAIALVDRDGGIAIWQLYFASEPPPTAVIVRVDGDNGRRPPLPPDPGILSKEVDRAAQLQIERVEAARKRVVEQLSELEAQKPAAGGGAPARTATMVAARVQCIGRGTNIMLVRDNDGTRVSYDNGPEVQPRISDLGTGAVLVSRIEPSNRIAIGFTKGDRSGTTLLMFDEAGRVQQTFPIECTVAAF